MAWHRTDDDDGGWWLIDGSTRQEYRENGIALALLQCRDRARWFAGAWRWGEFPAHPVLGGWWKSLQVRFECN